jgi:hypothetical protein
VVRARSGYCNAKPLDLLAGNPIEKDLEKRVTGSEAGNIQASMQLPYFYTAPETARVNVAIEMPLSTVKFEKKKGKLRTAVNVLGIAYLPDGGVGARFSDTVNLEFANKKELEEFSAKPFHYENQFEIASGKYTLKVAFSAGSESYGRLESPLAVDPYDGNKFSLSSVALSNTIHRVDEMDTSLTAQLLEDRKPLVVLGNQITPSGSNRFKKTDVVGLYTEIYAPLLASAKEPPAVGLQMRIVERSTGQQKSDSGFMRVPTPQAGNPVVPVGLRVPVDTLDSGSYRLEIKAIDEKGNASPVRSADVEVMD